MAPSYRIRGAASPEGTTGDGSRTVDVTPHAAEGELDLVIAGRVLRCTLRPIPEEPAAYELALDGRRERVLLARDGDRAFVRVRGRTYEVERLDEIARLRGEARARRGEAESASPMPGTVVEVHVAVGDRVDAGQPLLVIESMKLQTTIAAEIDGRVSALPFAVGDVFEQGALLVRIAADAPGTRGDG